MNPTTPRTVFLRVVINFLVIDFSAALAHVHNSIPVDSGGHEVNLTPTQPQTPPLLTRNSENMFLDELKSKLAKESSESSNYAYCHEEDNCTGNQYCDAESHQCQCHETSYVSDTCPTVGMVCTSCCCGKNVYCTGQFCEIYQIDAISSQMILSIVMVIGVVSIVFMIYRMCYRNTLQQRILLASREDSSRPSLSSLQIGVMSRMRDRPPSYETRHNFQSRNNNNNNNNNNNEGRRSSGVENPALETADEEVRRPVVPPTAPSLGLYTNSPPPPYARNETEDRSVASPRVSLATATAPPPYSVAIKSPSPSLGTQTGATDPSLSSFKEMYI